MFGYVTTNQEELKIKDFRRYQTFYCGLCRDLGDRHGQTARLTLTYDMTFLAVLLTGLYEPEERVEERFCPLHPAKKRLCRRNAAVSYAADMNLLLCYYNLLDDWLDEKKPVPLALARMIRGDVREIMKKYPRQARAVRQDMKKLRPLRMWRRTEKPGIIIPGVSLRMKKSFRIGRCRSSPCWQPAVPENLKSCPWWNMWTF